MPQYSEVDYWNKRYEDEEGNPYDWLFSFADLKSILEFLIPDKNTDILLVGAGNAPFSPDLYQIGGFKNITNIDLSDVVIMQQAAKYPEQTWIVMDAMEMTFPSHAFPVIIDKSLIDTLLCASQSAQKTATMIAEAYRVLQPGGRFITLSLHGIEEVDHYYRTKEFNWNVSCFHVKSDRWNEKENRKRSVAHTLIVCDKALADGTTFPRPYPLHIPTGTLGSDEYQRLKERAEQVNLEHALQLSSTEYLQCALFHAVHGDSAVRQLKIALMMAAEDARMKKRRESEASEETKMDTTEDEDTTSISPESVYDPENLFNTLASPCYFTLEHYVQQEKCRLKKGIRELSIQKLQGVPRDVSAERQATQ